MKVSIKKISAVTGFSPATVCNALNHKKGVNSKTAEIVFQAAKEMDYIHDGPIRKIKFVIYRKNGSIIDGTPFFSQLIDGFQKACRKAGFETVIVYLDKMSDSFEGQLSALVNDVSSAAVLLGTEMSDEEFSVFKDIKCPFLTLDYWNGSMQFDGVVIDNVDSAEQATEYLAKMGHTKIGYLRGGFRIKGFCQREEGYKKGLLKAGLSLNEDYTVTLSTSMEAAYNDMKSYLKKGKNLPTAFFADNDMIALGAMKALTEGGFKIPDDISIIGFDDLLFSEIFTLCLTSLRVPKQEMGKAAADLLIRRLNDKNSCRMKTEICTEFVYRDSVKKCA